MLNTQLSISRGHQQQPGAASNGGRGVPFRRQRKSNFSSAEVEILVREVAARRDVLFGGRGRTSMSNLSKSSDKMSKWNEIAAAVNGADCGEKRTVREVRKKWENVVSSFRRKIRHPNLLTSLIGTGRCPADEALACANAYCGLQPPPTPANLIIHQQHQQHEEEEDEIYETDPDELFLQPEVQIREGADAVPVDFSDGKGAGRVEDDCLLLPKVEASVEDEQPKDESLDMREIQMQKLQVMRELLEVEYKRLKVERKRFKLERMRFEFETRRMGAWNQD
ncbi:myb/SANT-like DNA-binding domain-containing protein 4 [Cloeon dipterum]|uniref:myb/SANT-like DNA-binding domain-containing protein 4 n=1 Tax=Cloeon dipterum TaxID=197152 RepID=UPI0032201AD9